MFKWSLRDHIRQSKYDNNVQHVSLLNKQIIQNLAMKKIFFKKNWKFSSKIMKKETAYIDEARFRLRLE